MTHRAGQDVRTPAIYTRWPCGTQPEYKRGMALSLSALDLVPLVRGGTSVAALRNAAELAQAVDRFGYTRLWYAEHHNMPGIASTSPEILIAHVGAVTTRIRLGAGGVMLPNHSPLKVAESYKLLEAMHPGRIDLGIGRAPGTDGLTALALRRSRAALSADDFLEQLSELIAWGNGEFPPDHPFRAVRAIPDDRPLPPLYILGSSDYGAKLAAQMGVAFAFAGHFSPDPPEPAMRAYRTGIFYRRCAGQAARDPRALGFLCRHRGSGSAHGLVGVAVVRSTSVPDVRDACRARTKRCRTCSRRRNRRSSLHTRGCRSLARPNRCAPASRTIVARTEADEVMIATHAADLAARIRSYELVAEAFELPEFKVRAVPNAM